MIYLSISRNATRFLYIFCKSLVLYIVNGLLFIEICNVHGWLLYFFKLHFQHLSYSILAKISNSALYRTTFCYFLFSFLLVLYIARLGKSMILYDKMSENSWLQIALLITNMLMCPREVSQRSNCIS